MYETIKSLKPYFFSLRDIDGKLGLDIKIPTNWEYEKIIAEFKNIKIKIQDSNDKFNLISLLTISTQEGYNDVISCTKVIMKINKEEEEKQKLFQQKINELKNLFANETLDKLKEINLFGNNGTENSTGIGMVEQGDDEGSKGD